MKYFIDTEFLEGKQDKRFLGIKYGETKPTIDLISIGIVAEDDREYYAISKDFNLKEAWNRWQSKKVIVDDVNCIIEIEHWIRDNVLKHIWLELSDKHYYHTTNLFDKRHPIYNEKNFTYNSLKYLINRYGKTNVEIAKEVNTFCTRPYKDVNTGINYLSKTTPKFYAYYADYDWVAFCWLFGNMIDLPNRFPMYCNDLKQTLDEKTNSLTSFELSKLVYPTCSNNVFEGLDTGLLTDRIKCLQYSEHYPIQTNEHNALSDARFNFELYKFLNTI